MLHFESTDAMEKGITRLGKSEFYSKGVL